MKRVLPYMSEPWFAVLRHEIETTSMTHVATRLGVSRGAVSQVFNGTGLYGDGKASAARFGERVSKLINQMRCPFLTQSTGEEHWISGEQCRDYAYRECPTTSSLATRHWQSCRQCPDRVPAPHGWNEQRGQFITVHPVRTRKRADQAPSPGVAAPDVPPTEKEAA